MQLKNHKFKSMLDKENENIKRNSFVDMNTSQLSAASTTYWPCNLPNIEKSNSCG